MIQKWLRVRARFATFRHFQAGVYRASAPVMPPSAAFGLLMNLAGIDIRDTSNAVTTQIRQNIPRLQIATGLVTPTKPGDGARRFPDRATLYQQLHSYPVGNSGEKTLKPKAKGAKYWIVPLRREILVGYDGMIGFATDDYSLLTCISNGIAGNCIGTRYGLPFLGDNNYMVDRLDLIDVPPEETTWYEPMKQDEGPRNGSCRLTIGIDRIDNSKTTSELFAPMEFSISTPPAHAWVWTPTNPK